MRLSSVFFLIGGLFILILQGCSEKNTVAPTDDSQIIVGSINENLKTTPDLFLSIEEIRGFMPDHNVFAKNDFGYQYENAYIHPLNNPEGEVDYFLAVSGIERDADGKRTSDCYTIYLKLISSSNGNLILAPPGGGHTCTGHCCSACELQPADDNHPSPWCKCNTPASTPSCENEARCDHSTAT